MTKGKDKNTKVTVQWDCKNWSENKRERQGKLPSNGFFKKIVFNKHQLENKNKKRTNIVVCVQLLNFFFMVIFFIL